MLSEALQIFLKKKSLLSPVWIISNFYIAITVRRAFVNVFLQCAVYNMFS